MCAWIAGVAWFAGSCRKESLFVPLDLPLAGLSEGLFDLRDRLSN